MASTETDRLVGITTAVAVKAPVKVMTTADITLSGAQTIDGVKELPFVCTSVCP